MPLRVKTQIYRSSKQTSGTSKRVIVPLPIQFVEFGGNSLVVISPKKDDARREAGRVHRLVTGILPHDDMLAPKRQPGPVWCGFTSTEAHRPTLGRFHLFIDIPLLTRLYMPRLENRQMGGNNSVVECNLAKVEVASSNLVSRSISTFPLPVLTRFDPGSNLFLLTLRPLRFINTGFAANEESGPRVSLFPRVTAIEVCETFFKDCSDENLPDPG
jgi:hypothetical protein